MFSPNIDNRSQHENPKLKYYVAETLDSIKNYFSELIGAMPVFDNYVTVRDLPLETQTVRFHDRKGTRTYEIPKGKVFGEYNTDTEQIVLDSSLFDSVKKKYLQDKGFDVPSPERVIGEEAIHHVQNRTGSMHRALREYGSAARDYIEGAASSLADYLFGSTDIYQYEKSLFRKEAEKKGIQDAFLVA